MILLPQVLVFIQAVLLVIIIRQLNYFLNYSRILRWLFLPCPQASVLSEVPDYEYENCIFLRSCQDWKGDGYAVKEIKQQGSHLRKKKWTQVARATNREPWKDFCAWNNSRSHAAESNQNTCDCKTKPMHQKTWTWLKHEISPVSEGLCAVFKRLKQQRWHSGTPRFSGSIVFWQQSSFNPCPSAV